MKKAEIKFGDQTAGWLTQDENGYHFVYDQDYLKKSGAEPVSLTLPFGESPFTSKVLFPFFDGLIPEGWLLDVTTKKLKISKDDPFGLLLATCRDCAGAVEIEAVTAV